MSRARDRVLEALHQFLSPVGVDDEGVLIARAPHSLALAVQVVRIDTVPFGFSAGLVSYLVLRFGGLLD
jgi:hypothetical protein